MSHTLHLLYHSKIKYKNSRKKIILLNTQRIRSDYWAVYNYEHALKTNFFCITLSNLFNTTNIFFRFSFYLIVRNVIFMVISLHSVFLAEWCSSFFASYAYFVEFIFRRFLSLWICTIFFALFSDSVEQLFCFKDFKCEWNWNETISS